MSRKGFLVDVEYCSGCQACRLACQQERGFDENKYGVFVTTQGPLNIEGDKWQYDFIPQFTDWCDLCADRTAKGKRPSCAHHCTDQVLEFGDVDELAKKIDRRKQMLWVLE